MTRKMKDSGIEWIGEIPEGWEVVKAKYLFAQRNEKGNSALVLLSPTQKYGVIPQSQLEGVVQVKESTDLRAFKTIHIGDFVISLRSFQGGFEFSNYEGVCSPAYQVFHATKDLSNDFFRYLFKSDGFISKINSLTVGIREGKNIQYWDFSNMLLALPPKEVQIRSAQYLSAKCTEIDTMLSKTRSSIEEYKKLKQAVITQAVTKGVRGVREMKDSGVEWIGEIPTTYSICKLKYLLKNPLKYGANESGIPYSDSLPRYIRITDITPDGNLKCTGKLSLSEESAKDYILEDGDILFARSGATVGKTFIYYQSYGRSAYAGYLIKASLNNKVSPKFVYYYTCSSLYEIWKNSIFIQSTIQNIGADRYANLPVPVPKTLQEQEEIADYLDAKCAEIDGLIAKKEQLVKELESYKKSLIYEVVTGKREV